MNACQDNLAVFALQKLSKPLNCAFSSALPCRALPLPPTYCLDPTELQRSGLPPQRHLSVLSVLLWEWNPERSLGCVMETP